jgi:drug/metabolite transporter (DMT)-like permease
VPAYVATGIAWGCSFLFIKYSLGFLTPFGVAFMRCALGAVTLLVIAVVTRVALPKEFLVWCHLWVVAMCLNIVPGVLFALAETRTTSIVAGIVNALTPLTTLFFILVVFRDEVIKRYQIVGLAVGLVGVLMVLGVWQGFGSNPWWAVLALLGAVRFTVSRFLTRDDSSFLGTSLRSPWPARNSFSPRSPCCRHF